MGRFTRLWAMAWKELLVVLLDRRVRVLLIAGPVIQLTLFGYASTLEVNAIDLGYVNRDTGIVSERLLSDLGGSPNMRKLRRYPSEDALLDAMEQREILGGMILPQDLSRRAGTGQAVQVSLLLDGRRTNTAQLVAGYIGEIVARTGAQVSHRAVAPAPQIVPSHWYNPNLDYMWFTMPGLIGLIVTGMVFMVSLLTVSRERELGSFDQLMVLPLTSFEILVGKTIPGFLVGMFNASIYVALIPLAFGVPLAGSVGLLFLASISYALVITGIGLSVSCLSQNQQQSFLSGFLVMVPLMLLSGYASPVDNMPGWLQLFAHVNPAYHMLVICEGIFLKNISAALVFQHIWPMLMVAGFTLALAAWLFRAKTA